MQHWVSLNGKLLPADEARVSVFDSAFMQGIGLFETMRAYGGRVFRLREHIDRLIASAGALGWTIVPDSDELMDNVFQVLRSLGDADARVRLTVTTGSLYAAVESAPPLTIVASAAPGDKYPDECYLKGVSVVFAEERQMAGDPTVGHKTTSYFARLASLRAAHVRSAFESLWFTPEDRLAEGSISSVFVACDECLYTPPLDTPVLPGIARAAVIELAIENDIPVQEKALSREDVLAADEMFLTNSMMEVMPVVRIGREPVGDAKVGDVTRELAVAYTNLVAQECGDE